MNSIQVTEHNECRLYTNSITLHW